MADEINADLLLSLDKRIDDLRTWYDQYFMGMRKRAPQQEKTSVQYLIRRLSNQKIQNTRLSFQFQQIVAKFNAYNQNWERNMSKVEMGTSRRDRFRMAKKTAAETAPPPPPAAAPRPAEKAGGQNIDKLYDDFVNARKQCNQEGNLSKAKLQESIDKQLPKLQERYKGKSVEFKVVVENGQAKLKATIK